MASTTRREDGVLGLGWCKPSSENGVHTFWAGASWALDAIDLIARTFVLGAMVAPFGVSAGQVVHLQLRVRRRRFLPGGHRLPRGLHRPDRRPGLRNHLRLWTRPRSPALPARDEGQGTGGLRLA